MKYNVEATIVKKFSNLEGEYPEDVVRMVERDIKFPKLLCSTETTIKLKEIHDG